MEYSKEKKVESGPDPVVLKEKSREEKKIVNGGAVDNRNGVKENRCGGAPTM